MDEKPCYSFCSCVGCLQFQCDGGEKNSDSASEHTTLNLAGNVGDMSVTCPNVANFGLTCVSCPT